MSNKKRNWFIKKAKQIFTQQRILLITGLCFLFFFTLSWQIQFIGAYLSKPKEVFPPFVQGFLLLVSLGWSIYWLVKILKGYRVSFSQWLVAAIILSISLYYYYFEKQEFYFHPFYFTKYKQLWLLWIPAGLFTITPLVNVISLLKVFNKQGVKSANDILTDEILEDFEESSPHKRVGEKLAKDIINQKNSAALSLGLTGPWGNGKSSVLNFVKKELQKENANIKRQKLKNLFRSHNKKLKELLVLEFSPYRNHNENEVAQEFFLMLSNTISNYHGKLGSLLLAYAQKLTNLYNKKDLAGFLAKPVSSLQGKSAEELYTTIDSLLKDLGKKVVILVDDLDRLRTTEILEVLKLLRNTADFHNLIFVVAMDKEYVVRRLKDQGEISNARFIDKFFQLEFYLPEIRKENLQEEFKKLVDSYIDTSSEFKMSIENALQHPNSLFNEYCTNYRDVKRLANQIRMDYPISGKEIILKDYINITCFKIWFPQILNAIYRETIEIVKTDPSKGLFFLESTNADKNKQQGETLFFMNKREIKEIAQNYTIFKKYVDHSENWMNNLRIDEAYQPLLIKSLAYLFGHENIVKSVDSIRYRNIFELYMLQSLDDLPLTNEDFDRLIDSEPDDNTKKLLNTKDTIALTLSINRFRYFDTEEEQKIIKAIKILCFILDINQKNRFTTENEVFKLCIRLSLKLFNDQTEQHQEKRGRGLVSQTLDNQNINTKTKAGLLSHVYENKSKTYWWFLDERTFQEKGLEYFNAYLGAYQQKTWNFNNFTWKVLYSNLKKISGLKLSLNKSFKNYWKERDTEILCVQLLKIDDFSFQSFKLSNIIPEIFHSYEAFVTFIMQDRASFEASSFKMYKDFLKLAAIVNFNRSILYNFKGWSRMQEKISEAKNNTNRGVYDELQGRIEVFFEIDDKEMIDKIKVAYLSDQGVRLEDLSTYEYKDKYYLVINSKGLNSTPENFTVYISLIFQVARESSWYIANDNLTQIKNGEVFITKKEGLEDRSYVKLISYQP
jgi:DNA polymerase III delta prime subunit